MIAVCLLALAHNQNFDNTACVGQNGTIDVGTAKLSNSFHVEDSLCTFTVHASHVDAVSVSRLAPGTGGYVDIGAHREQEVPAEVHGHGPGTPIALKLWVWPEPLDPWPVGLLEPVLIHA